MKQCSGECPPPAGRDRERGVTMVELVVTMLVLSVLTVAVAGLTIAARTTNSETVARLDQINAARTAVEGMSRSLRTSVKQSQLVSCAGCTQDAFVIGQDFLVRFYANVDNAQGSATSFGPSLVTYTIAKTGTNAGKLIETVLKPNAGGIGVTGYNYCNPGATPPTADCLTRFTTRTLASGVVTSANPVFSYYNADGAPLPTTAGVLTAGQLGLVLSIELRVTVLSVNATKPQPTTYIQRIMLPNAQSVIQQNKEATP